MRSALKLTVLVAVLACAPAAFAGVEVKKSSKGMTYSLRVPQGWDAAAGGLLVVGLHGQGGSNEQFMPVLEAADFLSKAVLVAPNATANAAWDESDLDLISDVIREVRGRYHTLRTVVFGFSRGAYCAFGLGLRHPEDVQAAIPHSGGLVVPVPADEAAKRQVFYVIHGDSDPVVNVEQSREAVKTLQAGGLRSVKYEEIPHLAHTIDRAATRRAFDWVEETLGPIGLTEAQAAERIGALEKALKAKDTAGAVEAFGKLDGAPRSAQPKIAGLAKTHAVSTEEPLAIAALGAAAKLGAAAGLPALKAGLQKGASDAVKAAAAQGLADVGGNDATALLIAGLQTAEQAKTKPDLEKAIQAALTRITGKTFASSAEWKRWASGKA